MMLGGTIATLTAFVVTNFQSLPALVGWLGPTVLILPLIAYWQVRLRRETAGRKPANSPPSAVKVSG